MPNDDERRNVAARLRELEHHYNKNWVVKCGELPAPVDDAMHVCCIDRIAYGSEICKRLADLIEPVPERTCRMIDNGAELCCSECDWRHDYDDEPKFCAGCGAKVVGFEKPRYCPECGMEVGE